MRDVREYTLRVGAGIFGLKGQRRSCSQRILILAELHKSQ